MSDLAKRLLACPRFRWMSGMQAVYFRDAADIARVVVCQSERVLACAKNEPLYINQENWLPDLTDPATLGCLLALVREVRGQPNAYARLRRNPRSFEGLYWEVLANAEEWRESALGHGSTEAEALVAALEAA